MTPELLSVLESLFWMVVQYTQTHGPDNRLWSHNLGAPADAMRILNRYGLLDIDDLENRDVWANILSPAEYQRRYDGLVAEIAVPAEERW